MSSVTRFLRQIPTGLAVFNQGGTAASDLTAIANAACEFIPTGSNYVGNYPPGYVIKATAAVQAAILLANSGYTQTFPIVRDMGKTIFAQISNSTTATPAAAAAGATVNYGYFRQIQVLVPQPINSNQGFIGGPNGNVFGVVGGSPDSYSQYLTVYVPTSVAGVFATQTANGFSAAVTPLPAGPQGQM